MNGLLFSRVGESGRKGATAGAHDETRAAGRAGRVLLSQRRLRMLRALARSTHAHSAGDACAAAAAALAENADDLAFALIYLLDSDKERAQLAGATRLTPGEFVVPVTIELDNSENAWWPLRRTVETGALQRVSGLDGLAASSGVSSSETVKEAVVLPIAQPGQQRAAGFLLAGLSPRLLFDDDYRGFLELTAIQIAASIAEARAYEEERKRAQALAEIDRARREIESMRREVEAVLEQANRRESEFLANMSHEIRSPMTAILGYSDILLLHLQDPDDVECVKTIQESGNYLLEIINDILDLSKIEAGTLRVNKERVALYPLLREIQSLMDGRAREKGLSLIFRHDGFLPERIESNRTRLRQILINLLSNAIKFTEHGGVELIARAQPDSALLQIDIVDTGIGMSQELQSRLFQAFSQGDASLTRRYGGTGLGLAISKRLVEMLDGNITFVSAPRKGTTFSVTIPVGVVEGARWRDFDGSAFGASAPGITLHGRRLLVADDRTEIRYLLRQFIEDAGGEVVTAASGLAAIEVIQNTKSGDRGLDLIVMDMAMPGLDGYEATRRLRARGFDKPIVALTAAASKEDRDRCLEAGCDAYLSKPVNRQTILDLIAEYTGDAALTGEKKRVPGAEACPGKILLVDDHRTACKSTARLLEMSGYEVRVAFNGKSAIAAAQGFAADALILDIKLPDMSGYELLRRLREAGLPAARSIALTGYGEDTRSNDPNENFDHFLLKPVDFTHLEALLR
jgi:two-component system, chemotaxis family, CheB/CheR fusion protein